jgi:hypothetical protein
MLLYPWRFDGFAGYLVGLQDQLFDKRIETPKTLWASRW